MQPQIPPRASSSCEEEVRSQRDGNALGNEHVHVRCGIIDPWAMIKMEVLYFASLVYIYENPLSNRPPDLFVPQNRAGVSNTIPQACWKSHDFLGYGCIGVMECISTFEWLIPSGLVAQLLYKWMIAMDSTLVQYCGDASSWERRRVRHFRSEAL